MRKPYHTILSLMLILIGSMSFAQSDAKIITFVTHQIDDLNVSLNDVDDLQHQHTAILGNGKSKVHTYVQTIDGVEIIGALVNVVESKDGNLTLSNNTLVANIEDKINSSEFSIEPSQIIENIAKRAGESSFKLSNQITKVDKYTYAVGKLPFTQNEVELKKRYVFKNDKLYPVLVGEYDFTSTADYLMLALDANTGETISIFNYTTRCNQDHNDLSVKCKHNVVMAHDHSATAATVSAESSSYKVYAWPAEDPNHASQTVETDPYDPMYSPFGWHDTNGVDGAEYTITRGNNVHAYQDRADAGESTGDEPDGGAELQFLFDHDQTVEPVFNTKAAVTNMFYQVNKMHDFTASYGFGENDGNFQQRNYTGNGDGGDYVLAEGQDGSGTNNANFATPSDGGNGRMQMYLYNQGGDRLFSVEEPAALAGFYSVGITSDDAAWEFEYATSPVEGKIVLATTGQAQGGTQVCSDVANSEDVKGNVAMVDRGECAFVQKAQNAEAAGATACIICNIVGVNGGTGEELLTMAAQAGFTTSIPTVFMAKSNCDRIKAQINAGVDVVVKIEERETSGPNQLDACFNNGTIAHEFGHGVSNRLTAGPSNTFCLYNPDTDNDGQGDVGEQMGEGWSDFFNLIAFNDADNFGAQARGVGNYTDGEGITGRGIRTYPYSTDFGVNPSTYDYINNASVPHGVGAVWCTMLWDMYWAFVDMYGFDIDYDNKESGNSKAIQLVMDGMKIQPCNPGFVDGRDAILKADIELFDGAHQCMIWEVFARRGLGYYADQADPLDHRDGTSDFEPLPTCIKQLKVSKMVTGLIQPGDDVEVAITYANHTEADIQNAVITDEIPEGLTYISSTSSVEPTISGNMISWELGDVATLAEGDFTVLYGSDETVMSERLFYDPITSQSSSNWDVEFNIDNGTNVWSTTDLYPHTGQSSWFVRGVETESDQSLTLENLEVSGERPVLRFYHAIVSEVGSDGGFVSISNDGGETFNTVSNDLFIRNGYDSELQYGTFAIPSLGGFTGLHPQYRDSYIDLSGFNGETISIKFRYGSDENTLVDVTEGVIPGWYIDDVELLDLKSYVSQSCFDADDADKQCAEATETLIDTGLPFSSIADLDGTGAQMRIYPNPTSTGFSVELKDIDPSAAYQVSLKSLQGVIISEQMIGNGSDHQIVKLDTHTLANGMYIVQVTSQNGIITEKVQVIR